eukprot:TRINITY_DN43725_c0_g1_i1.p1 TRINITY_DN43725_c0_g1~~TRINITY_DN43725_c0_g1_i1.p1  ORF type:complete len:739 (+),score=288.69 TRINITY_DN43725_c0_g1_i1:64-2280(+)
MGAEGGAGDVNAGDSQPPELLQPQSPQPDCPALDCPPPLHGDAEHLEQPPALLQSPSDEPVLLRPPQPPPVRQLQPAGAPVPAAGHPDLTCSSQAPQVHLSPTPAARQHRPRRRLAFEMRLRRLLRLSAAGSARLAVLLYCLCTGRVALSMRLATIGGTAIQHFVSRRWGALQRTLRDFFLWSWVAAAVSAAIKLLEGQITVQMRLSLSRALQDRYLDAENFFLLRSRIGSVCSDVKGFCEDVVQLFTEQGQRAMELVTYTVAVGVRVGWSGAVFIWLVIGMCQACRKLVHSVPITQFQDLARAEQELKESDAKVAAHAEEVATMHGVHRELSRHNQQLSALVTSGRRANWLKFVLSISESVLGKYAISVAGYLTMIMPYYRNMSSVRLNVGETMARDYILTTQHLTALNQAIEALLNTDKWRIASLSSKTERLHDVLEQVEGRVEPAAPPPPVPRARRRPASGPLIESWKQQRKAASRARELLHDRLSRGRVAAVAAQSGASVVHGDCIKLEEVDIVGTEGQVLAAKLSFKMDPGMHVLVVPAGKEVVPALCRAIGGLLPVVSGRATLPRSEDFLVLRSSPYLFRGDLLEQVTYPHTEEHRKQLGLHSSELIGRVLSAVDNRILCTHSLHDRRDWSAVDEELKQKIALARIYYHMPRFVVLEQGCLAALTAEEVAEAHSILRAFGVGVLTVAAHEQDIDSYDSLLHVSDRGPWSYVKLQRRRGGKEARELQQTMEKG